MLDNIQLYIIGEKYNAWHFRSTHLYSILLLLLYHTHAAVYSPMYDIDNNNDNVVMNFCIRTLL